MRKCLTTFGFGIHAILQDIQMPGLVSYARRHGYDLFVPQNPSGFMYDSEGRHISWLKVPVITTLLRTYDFVLWLDADVAIIQHEKDILDDCGPEPMSLVVHKTADGFVPNCGVWPIRRAAAPVIDSLWKHNGFSRSGCWWEQAALIHVLGGDPDATPVKVPANTICGELPYEWNPHVNDDRGVPADCRFFHATQVLDRADAMRRMLGNG